ncbi:unnamed protein product [Camellia sinensis]
MDFRMKLPTYPIDGNQALRSSGLRYTRVLTSPFYALTFAKAPVAGFRPCELRFSFLFDSFHFFSFDFLFLLFSLNFSSLFFLFFVFFFFFYIFCFFSSFLYFSLALTFAWVALPGFRPSEPLKG